MNRQQGLALVIVLWILSLLIIMAGSFALTMRRETTVISALKDNAEVLAVAESGLALAWQMLTLTDENKRWRADGSIYPVFYRDAEIRVRLLSEQGKVDINQADETLLRTLLQSTDADLDRQQSIVSAIIDWRDRDDLVYVNGAEKQEYQNAGLNYGPANKPFTSIDELQLVLGVDDHLYQQLQPLVTVFSGQSQVNLRLAAKEVLQALAVMDDDTLNDYLWLRLENARLQLPPPPLPAVVGVTNQLGGGAEVYTVIVQARLYGESNAGIRTIIKKASDNQSNAAYQVLDWQQLYGSASLFSDEMESLLVTLQDESGH